MLFYCPNTMVTWAIENRVYIINTNRVVEEERDGQANRFIARSHVVFPKAEILARADDEECVRIVEIDQALNKDIMLYNNIFYNRQQDLCIK